MINSFLRLSIPIASMLLVVISCKEVQNRSVVEETKSIWLTFDIAEKTDEEYPDNPDIGYRSDTYLFEFFKNGRLAKKDTFTYDFQFDMVNGDTLKFTDVDISEWIPTIPNRLKKDTYLSELALVNHEWNRNQVRFDKNFFTVKNESITRVDIARNCLNSYLWEVIVYKQEGEKEMAYAHGWFNFPEEEYQGCFVERNKTDFEHFKGKLVDWKDPLNMNVDASLLREVTAIIDCSFEDLSDQMYLEKGERAKKRKEVVFPESFSSMRELQSDSTTFATFTPPGLYSRADPRKTELGRLQQLDSVFVKAVRVEGIEPSLSEIEFYFSDNERRTNLIIGGIDLSNIPVANIEEAHMGWQTSMGFGNHTFYESYGNFLATNLNENPYYGYFTDGDNKWQDSHKIGVDGPLMHFDKENPKLLHVWLLSFERHALVGHYAVEIN